MKNTSCFYLSVMFGFLMMNLCWIKSSLATVKLKHEPLSSEQNSINNTSFYRSAFGRDLTKTELLPIQSKAIIPIDWHDSILNDVELEGCSGQIINSQLNNVKIIEPEKLLITDSTMTNVSIMSIGNAGNLTFQNDIINDLRVSFGSGNQDFINSQLSDVVIYDSYFNNMTFEGGSINNLTLQGTVVSAIKIHHNTVLTGNINIIPNDIELNFIGGSTSTSGGEKKANYQMNGKLYLISMPDSPINNRFDLGNFSMSGGQVIMSNKTDSDYLKAYFGSLEMASLNGNGRFELHTNVANGIGNTITVYGQANGKFDIYIIDSGHEPKTGATLDVIRIGGGDATFTLTNPEQKVAIGTYTYELVSNDNRTWRLAPISSRLSDSAKAVINSSVTNPIIIQNTMNNIHNQLDNQNNTAGNSMAMGAGSSKVKVNNNDNINFDQDIQFVMLSYDETVELADDNLLTLGVYAGNSNSDLDLKGVGSGKLMSYSVAGYTKYKKENGFYSEAILTLNYANNNTYALASSGSHANSKYHLFGSGLSLRSGMDIKFRSISLEPYIGARAIIVGKKNYQLSNGMMAGLGESHSLVANWGIKAKRKFTFDSMNVEGYMSVTNEREFVDNNRVTVNNNKFTSDLSGSWYRYAVGVKTPIYDDFTLNVSYEIMHGKNIKSPGDFRLQLGYDF